MVGVAEAWAAQRQRVEGDLAGFRALQRKRWVDRWNVELDAFRKEVEWSWRALDSQWESPVWHFFSPCMRVIFWSFVPKTLPPAGSSEDSKVLTADPVNRWLRATNSSRYSRTKDKDRLREATLSQAIELIGKIREALSSLAERLVP